MLTSFLEKDLAVEIKTDNVGVFYLGDLDSFVLASSASQIRKNVTLYVFTLDGEKSIYVENAERVADLMGWSNNTVDIKTENFISQIRETLDSIEIAQKSDLAYFYALMRCLSLVKEDYMLCGYGLETICGLSKNYQKEHRNNPALFHSTRLDYFAYGQTSMAFEKIKQEFGIVVCVPFLTFRKTSEYFMNSDWRQLNVDENSGRVMLKAPLRDAYHARIKERGLVDTHTKALKVSGLNQLLNEILKSKAINFNSRRRLIELLMDWRLKRIEKRRLDMTSGLS